MSLWLPCGLLSLAEPITATVTVQNPTGLPCASLYAAAIVPVSLRLSMPTSKKSPVNAHKALTEQWAGSPFKLELNTQQLAQSVGLKHTEPSLTAYSQCAAEAASLASAKLAQNIVPGLFQGTWGTLAATAVERVQMLMRGE